MASDHIKNKKGTQYILLLARLSYTTENESA